MIYPIALTSVMLLAAAMAPPEPAPQVLLLVRERLRPGMEGAYDKNEREIAAACARWRCPHPYLALSPVAGPPEVWWLNAFASPAERDQVASAYARNEPLMARLGPLGSRKEGFREAPTTTTAAYRPDLSGGAGLRIAGARFLVIQTTRSAPGAAGAVFESPGGERFVIASADARAAAEHLAAGSEPRAVIFEVRPQWSFPDESWIAADPDFWRSNAAARERRRTP